MAASKSPLASTNAFLQSIMPAPVCWRSLFTSDAEICTVDMLFYPFKSVIHFAWLGGVARRPRKKPNNRGMPVENSSPCHPLLFGLEKLFSVCSFRLRRSLDFRFPWALARSFRRVACVRFGVGPAVDACFSRSCLFLRFFFLVALAFFKAFLDRFGNYRSNQADCLGGIVVGRNWEVDVRRVGVGIDHRKRRYVQFLRFANGDVLFLHGDDKECTRKALEVADA